MTTKHHPQTMALHEAFRADPATGSVAVPIYQTTSYDLESTERASRLFGLEELGNIYSRIMNPTCDVLERRMAALEGGVAALAVASGQAAVNLALQNITHAGDNIVCSSNLYGGTWNLFANTFPTMGIEVRFVDPGDPEGFRQAADDRTRAFFAETLPNPSLEVFPIAEVAEIGEELGIPLIVDNTAAPLICRPFDHGAHVVVYSATKYIGGHGTSIGGLVIDGGTFDWDKHADRFPMLTQTDPSYHGAVWTEATRPMGPVAYIMKARCTLLRDVGYAMSPFNAFAFIQGLETLPLRMREHCANAAALAEHLSGHPDVERVIYPGQMEGLGRARAERYLSGGFGGLLGVELRGGSDAGRAFINGLQLVHHVANIGDAKTLAIHPASTTHSQLNTQEQLAAGVTPGYVRLSVGIEHVGDIIADIDQSLDSTTTIAQAA